MSAQAAKAVYLAVTALRVLAAVLAIALVVLLGARLDDADAWLRHGGIAKHSSPTVPVVHDIGTGSGVIGIGQSFTITIPAGGVPAGSFIFVAAIQGHVNFGGPSISDSAGNTYHSALFNTGAAGSGVTLTSFYAYNVAALTAGQFITVTNTSGAGGGSYSDFNATAFYATGVYNGGDPYDSGASTTSNSSGTPGTQSITLNRIPLYANSLAVGILGGSSGWSINPVLPAVTPPDDSIGNNRSVGGGSVVTSVQQTISLTICCGNGFWAMQAMAFRPN